MTDCGCGRRAKTLLEKLGYQKQGDDLVYSGVVIPVHELERHHLRLTLYGVWKFLTLSPQ